MRQGSGWVGRVLGLLLALAVATEGRGADDAAEAPQRGGAPEAEAPAPGAGAWAEALARGDAAWADRARGAREAEASMEPIGEAIDAYDAALVARPTSLEARWKLMRSLHFAGEFAGAEPEARHRLFERATQVSEAGVTQLAERAGEGRPLDELPAEALGARVEAAGLSREAVASFYFWSAIAWGAWGRDEGLLSLVREGVANRMHRYAEGVLALAPGTEEGGARRLLGRLHAELPRIPFLSGWVDRSRALPLLEEAFAQAPEHPGNRLLLAVTLLEQAPEQRERALELLRSVAEATPRADARIEELAVREQARERLAEAGEGGR